MAAPLEVSNALEDDPNLGQENTSPSENDHGIVASEVMSALLNNQPARGKWIVTLHEGVGFSLPEQHNEELHNHRECLDQDDGSQGPFLPYALLDFDKTQVFGHATSGSMENPVWAGDEDPYRFDVSLRTKLTVRLYLGKSDAYKGNQDIYLGTVRLNLSFEEQPPSGTDWFKVENGTGKIRLRFKYVKNRIMERGALDKSGTYIGKSGSVYVYHANKRDSRQPYAVKTIRKASIIPRPDVELLQVDNPFIAGTSSTIFNGSKVSASLDRLSMLLSFFAH
ncbi:hypothetical protein VMCG_03661 [Cytospora schulzeri]|uniref:C2 domain-containing protein n=1 Tax=Cytospora schulzeri TaxID=448051 RepID=A0A423WWM7_9PEZI|nr:hypothetical protein VMCG_03661 [Valsa malicola]